MKGFNQRIRSAAGFLPSPARGRGAGEEGKGARHAGSVRDAAAVPSAPTALPQAGEGSARQPRPAATRWRPTLAAVTVASAGWLAAGCATSDPAALMSKQADAQIALSRLQDKQAQEQYDDRAVYRGLIERMQQQGLYYASLAHLDAYQQRFGDSADVAMLRADALRETEQDEAAAIAYRNLLGSSHAARAYHGLGLLAGRSGDFGEAVTQLEASLSRDPTNALVASDLGYALMRAGQLQQARVPVMQALQLDGANPRIVSNAVVWMLATRQREQATALMERASMSASTRKAIAQEADRIAREAARQERAAARTNGTRPKPQRIALTTAAQPGQAAATNTTSAP